MLERQYLIKSFFAPGDNVAIRKRGNSYQVVYRCPGEASPRTETFRSEDEALIRNMQIKLAKKNGTFEPPVKISKGTVRARQEITVSDFLDEYVEVYGLKLIAQNNFRPVVFHSLRHSSTSLKLKLSRGNIKAVQGDTGHAEARMVTDTYAHGFDAGRKLIAHEMDTGFFAKVGAAPTEEDLDADMLRKLKSLIQSHPELLSELLKETEKDGKAGAGST